MPSPITINCNFESSRFELSGDIESILRIPRAVFSLRRLGFKKVESTLQIQFGEGTKIATLRELQMLLEKFRIPQTLSDTTQTAIASYAREQAHFREFSENARSIRNDEFKQRPELLSLFTEFQSVVKQRIVRPLYPMQLLSAFHMAFSQNACNFAVPGSGKTSIVFAAYCYLKGLPKDHYKRVDRILVIGPLSSFAPWEIEYETCFGRTASSQRLSGDNTIRRAHKEQHLYSANPAELTLIWHGTVSSLQDEIVDFLKTNKTMVVVDEAHRIKNPEGVWARSAVEIAKEARARIILTGTPIPNGYEDLYNLFQFLYPVKFKEILGYHLANLKEMTKTSGPDSNRVKEFTHNISPYFIRIKKADLKLPETEDHKISVKMDRDQREIYDFVETKYVNAFRKDTSGGLKDVLNRARLIRLRQAATNPTLLLKPIYEAFDPEDDKSLIANGEKFPEEFLEDSQILALIRTYAKTHVPPKFQAVKDLYEMKIHPINGKIIVWSIFIQNAKGLRAYLDSVGITSRLLIGEVEQPERESVVAQFNDPLNQQFHVVIANPFAVAESISLHKGCHNACYMERDYNCANFLQSKDRIHRYGLANNQTTDYYFLLSTDSIDEVIDDRLKLKVRRMEKIIDDEIPLFARINDADETDLIKALLIDYAKRA